MDNENSGRAERRTAFVARELRRLNIDIAALQETRIADEGQLTEQGGGYVFFWKGKASAERRLHGVGFAIKKELVSRLEHLPVGRNERLMTLQLSLVGGTMAMIISAYAPTLMAEDSVKEEFYQQLDMLLSQIPPNHRILLLGDFNARVGKDHLTWNGVIGKDGIGNCNDNGRLLLSTCTEHGLTVTNTLFRQRDRQKTSWRHPRSAHWHLIDYIIVKQKDKKDVFITKAVTGSDACWTDHRLIMSKINFNIAYKHRKSKKKTHAKFNTVTLTDSEQRQRFQDRLTENIADTRRDSADVLWMDLSQKITETCKEELGVQKRKHEDWFDENDREIKDLIDEKRFAFNNWQRDFRNPTKRGKYHSLRATVQKRTREMKNDFWLRKSDELQSLADQNKSREFFAATRKLYGPTNNGVRPVMCKDGNICKDKQGIKERW